MSNQGRAQIADALRDRREEIEQALLARVYGIADPTEVNDSEYIEGFRHAVSAAFDFSLEVVEATTSRVPLLPSVLLSQARLAARNGVSLDTVLRRYAAGHALLVDFLIEETERKGDLSPTDVRHLLSATSSSFDQLLASVSEEYMRETHKGGALPSERRTELVRRVLGGEPVDLAELNYDLNGWHLGLVLEGEGIAKELHELARAVDRRLLLVEPGSHVVWAWLGGRSKLDPSEVLPELPVRLPAQIRLALGEAASGRSGWRLSHLQAKAVLPLARTAQSPIVRYANNGLLASIARDDVLVQSLRQRYLDPLDDQPDGGKALRETLRTYLSTDHNISSAAARLALTRQTVRKRLRRAEEKLGVSLDKCSTELDLALRLEQRRVARPSISQAPKVTIWT